MMSGILLLVGNITPEDYFGYGSTLQEHYRKCEDLRLVPIPFDDTPSDEGAISDWFDENLRAMLRNHGIAPADVRSIVGDERWAVYLEDHGLHSDLENIHFPNLKLLYVVRIGNNGRKWFDDIFSPGSVR